MIDLGSGFTARFYRWVPDRTIEANRPLTLSPSIVVPECGCHGFILGGKWVTA